MKICKDCNRTLPEAEFYHSPYAADGYYGNCKECYYRDRQLRTPSELSIEFIERHERKRELEQQIAWSMGEPETVRDESLTFSGVVDSFFRSQRKSYSWSVK